MSIILGIHNLLRWVIVFAAVFTLYRMFRGLSKKNTWTSLDSKAGLIFTIALDIQLLLGLILYFILSPMVKSFFANISAAMSESTLRYWGVEQYINDAPRSCLRPPWKRTSKKASFGSRKI